jgi:hypothetical protein
MLVGAHFALIDEKLDMFPCGMSRIKEEQILPIDRETDVTDPGTTVLIVPTHVSPL